MKRPQSNLNRGNAQRGLGAGGFQTALQADHITLAAAINTEHQAAFGAAHEADAPPSWPSIRSR